MQEKYKERRKLVAEMLEQNQDCPAGILIYPLDKKHVCMLRTTEVHEILTRARGGSILDRSNCVALCHSCHAWITVHPKEAHAIGMVKSSWE